MAVLSAMKWIPVDSGVFEAAAYRHQVRQLYLRFRDGDVYRYFDCPVSVYGAFLKAESKGRYFAERIRKQFRDELVYRKDLYSGSGTPESLEQQLTRSVKLTRAGVTQKRDAAHTAGVQE